MQSLSYTRSSVIRRRILRLSVSVRTDSCKSQDLAFTTEMRGMLLINFLQQIKYPVSHIHTEGEYCFEEVSSLLLHCCPKRGPSRYGKLPKANLSTTKQLFANRKFCCPNMDHKTTEFLYRRMDSLCSSQWMKATQIATIFLPADFNIILK
jgi:hypothetical protein